MPRQIEALDVFDSLLEDRSLNHFLGLWLAHPTGTVEIGRRGGGHHPHRPA